MRGKKSHQARRSSRQKLGQHFLSDISWRARIAETLRASPDSTWIEIGAGHGEMTGLLAPRARRVIAIETDAALASALRERAAHFAALASAPRERLSRLPAGETGPASTPGSPAKAVDCAATAGHTIEIVHADILSVDLAELVARPPAANFRQGTALAVPQASLSIGPLGPEASLNLRLRVYGNLPYYITSPILAHLFRFADHIDSIHIVTQLEVAQRIAARPHSRNYGYLSTLCQYYAQPKILLRIPPGAFHPPPKVTSALIEMRLPGERTNLDIRDDAAFLKFLQLCFAHKRKTLRNNLRGAYAHDAVAKALAVSALTDNSRAEELTLRQFARIFLSLTVK